MSDTKPRGRIVVVGGEKGGTSKTTTAVNFAAILASKGRDVLLVDTDPQMSASDWVAIRDADHPDRRRVGAIQKTGSGLARELLDLSGRYDEIIVDAGGRESPELRAAMLMADVIVSPFQASSFDLWTIRKLQELYVNCSAARNPEAPPLKVILVLSRASTNPNVQDTSAATDFIEQLIEQFPEFHLSKHPIRERTVFRKTASAGLGVVEFDPKDEKAEFEIRSLFKEVYGE